MLIICVNSACHSQRHGHVHIINISTISKQFWPSSIASAYPALAASMASYADVEAREMLSSGETEAAASSRQSRAVKVTGAVSVLLLVAGVSAWAGRRGALQ
eukprot:2664914-Lingulodinium_polyedra.AAC.1